MDKDDKFLLFIYGTLKRDGQRHRAIQDQTFLGEATTKTGYQLLDLGSYPGLIRVEQDGRKITGELWEIHNSRLPMLDQIEGAPRLYRLEPIEIEGENRKVVSYFFKLLTSAKNAPIIEKNYWENKKN